MRRRHFQAGLALALAGLGREAGADGPSPWARIESSAGGRLGVAVLDTATGAVEGHRLDERFPMCSTFKWLAAACVLHRVDLGEERLDRRVRYGREALVPYAPVTEKHAGGEGLTMAELCEAAITLSDNAAANLVLASIGGPAAFTRYARSLGDAMTRLDRIEPQLNEGLPGDERDTTTPRAMARTLGAAALGDALSPAGRARLVRWLEATETGRERLRAGVPGAWRVGDKTGSGGHGSTNDVAVMWPPDRAPLVVAAYLTETTAPAPRREAALADVGRAVAARRP